MYSKKAKSFVPAVVLIFALIFNALCPSAAAQETAQMYLRFDSASTAMLIRVTAVISSPDPVGAFHAEYDYDSSYLRLESVVSNNGGQIYSRDFGGTIGVIYLNKNPTGENYLTFEFSVVKEGSSAVTAYYLEVLTRDKSPVEFKNNNDCNISVGEGNVTAESVPPSKTSSSYSGSVSVIKDNNSGGSSSVKPSTGSNGNKDDGAQDSPEGEEFFSFTPENPALWAAVGFFSACGVMLVAVTGYKMGLKRAGTNAKEDPKKESGTDQKDKENN